MANEVVNRRLNIYIDQAGAEQSLERLTKKENELLTSIEKAKKANKDFTKELQQLASTRTQIGQIKDVIDGKVLPSIKMAEAAVGSLRRELKRLPADSEAALKKLQELKKAEITLNQVKNAAYGVDKALDGIKKDRGIKGIMDTAFGVFIGGGLLGAVQQTGQAVISFFEDSITEALAAEKATARLQATLNNLGRDDVFERLSQSAVDFADTFRFIDNDEVIGVFEQLITYGKLTEKQINELTPVIIDFAAKSQISLEQSASVIIKALEGNGKALKEYGVEVTGAKNETEAFGIIMDQLKPKVEGAAKAFGETTAGQIAITRQEISNLKEDIGTKLLPVVKDVFQWFDKSLGTLNKIFSTLGTLNSKDFSAIDRLRYLTGNVNDDLRNRINKKTQKQPAPDQVDQFGRVIRPGTDSDDIIGTGGGLSPEEIEAKRKAAQKAAEDRKKQLDDLAKKYKEFSTTIKGEALDAEMGEIFAAFRKINDEAAKDIATLQEFQKKGLVTSVEAEELTTAINVILEKQREVLQEKFKLNPIKIPLVPTADQAGDINADAKEYGKKVFADLTEGIKEQTGPTWLQENLDIVVDWSNQVKDIFLSVIAIRSRAESDAFDQEVANNNKRKDSAKKLFDSKVINQKEYDRRVASIDAQQEKREKEMRIRQFQRDKAAQTVQAVVSGAQSVLTNLARFGAPIPPNFIAIAAMTLTAATTIAQIAAIRSAKPPQFEKGGFIPSGSSHKQGGISLIDNRTGANVGEVEGGEPIISKKVYARNKPAIDAMLSAGWQNASYQPINIPRLNSSMATRYFADGGILPQPGQGDNSTQALMNVIKQLNDRLSYPLYAEVLYGEYESKASKINGIRNSGVIR